MNASIRVSVALLLCLLLVSHIGVTQTIAEPVYFYITSDPAMLERAFSSIFRARMKQFDKERISAQYYKHLQRTLGKDWFKYAHHAFIHGPFSSESEAKSHYNKAVSDGVGAVTYPRVMADFAYRDASLVLGVVSIATAEGSPSNPSPWLAALSDLPIRVYWPGEYSWTRSGGGTSSTVMSVEELRPSAAVVWIDQAASLSADGANSFKDYVTQALSKGLDVVVAAPGRSPAAVTSAVAGFRGQFTAKGKRLDVVAAEAAAMRLGLSEQLKEMLKWPIAPLKVNELMASNKGAVKGEGGDFPDWVEIVNTGTGSVDLEGMCVTDTNGARSMRRIAGTDRTRTTVPAGGRIVLWLDEQPTRGPTHIGLRLSAQGDRFTLLDIDGVTVIDQVEFGPQPPDKTYARVPDAGDRWQAGRDPTPGAVNK